MTAVGGRHVVVFLVLVGHVDTVLRGRGLCSQIVNGVFVCHIVCFENFLGTVVDSVVQDGQ